MLKDNKKIITIGERNILKGIIDDEFKEMIIKEMGDVQWYMARLADQFDIEFESIFTENIKKLQSRKKRNKLHGSGDTR